MDYKDVVKYFGSGSKAARELGITKQAVSCWKTRGRIPFEAQYRIQLRTRGKLKAILPA